MNPKIKGGRFVLFTIHFCVADGLEDDKKRDKRRVDDSNGRN
jgi:hypothetical protein